MDTGDGYFTQVTEETLTEERENHPDHGGVFRVGEIVELRGSIFRVQSIRPKKLVLKLLRQKEADEARERILGLCDKVIEQGENWTDLLKTGRCGVGKNEK